MRGASGCKGFAIEVRSYLERTKVVASAPKSSPSKINDEITVLNSSLCQAESVCFVKAAKEAKTGEELI